VTYCLSIAGFDPTAGAGVLADFETFYTLSIQARAVVTAVTAQNQRRVLSIEALSPRRIKEQLDALLLEGRPAAVKVGMLATAAVAREVAYLLGRLGDVPVVLDPVLWASSGRALLEPRGIPVLRKTFLPLATVITPNRREAEKLLGRKIRGRPGLIRAAKDLLNLGPQTAVITGGDARGALADVLADARGVKILEGKRVRTGMVRGTGCRYSSALAVYLAKGRSIREAARRAQEYIRRYLVST
jgi:hydroxymethylpyrimidine kinase/phosphomethylpyrimidine kinase